MMTVNVFGEELELPDEVQSLGECLYLIPREMLRIVPFKSSKTYKWSNPRHFGMTDEGVAQGFGEEDMDTLDRQIVEKGVTVPLVCCWAKNDGKVSVDIVDGERRFTAINRQLARNAQVFCQGSKAFRPAAEIHKKVVCRVYEGNDDSMFEMAWMVNECSVPWGDGAKLKIIQQFRESNLTDKEILDRVKKSPQWLKEMDRLRKLDQLTLEFYIKGRVNRTVALKLAKIDDLEQRHSRLHACFSDAIEQRQEDRQQLTEDLEHAQDKEDIASAELTEIRLDSSSSSDDIQASEDKLTRATERVEQKQQEIATQPRPRAKSKNFRRATRQLQEADGSSNGSDLEQALTPVKIHHRHMEVIESLIENKGKSDDGRFVMDVPTLNIVLSCYKAILRGDENIIEALCAAKRQKQTAIITDRKMSMETV